MTLEEAVAAFENDFHVVDAFGFPNNPNVPASVDASKAPTGEPYVSLVSGGIKEQGAHFPAFFKDESLAVEAWLSAAWRYADERGGKTLYWRSRPRCSAQDYIAVNQMGAMNDPEWRGQLHTTLCVVFSRMLVSKGDEGAPEKPKVKRK